MKYNGQEIGIPEVWQIAEYIALKHYDLSAQAVYDKYSKKGWVCLGIPKEASYCPL